MITPSVPSAPIKTFVRSGPAELFLALERVLRTWPEGSTAVRLRNLENGRESGNQGQQRGAREQRNKKGLPFGSSSSEEMKRAVQVRYSVSKGVGELSLPISNGIRACRRERKGSKREFEVDRRVETDPPEHPVEIMPPIVAPGPGSRGRKSLCPNRASSSFSS